MAEAEQEAAPHPRLRRSSHPRAPKQRGGPCSSCCNNSKDEPLAYLYAFDFDHTIVDQNSDTAVMEVIHDPIPSSLQRLFDGTNWEEYMDNVFKFVASEGGTYEIIASKIRDLQPTEGMPHLLHRIAMSRSLNHHSKFIVISDANTFFIETFLSGLQPPVVPDAMITNRAEKTDEGVLKLTPYEQQTECPFCPRNLCKGNALKRWILQKGPFERVYYSGDGGNDVCPAMMLSEHDVVFCRKDYAMEKIIKHGSWKGRVVYIKAKVVYWQTAIEIEKEIYG